MLWAVVDQRGALDMLGFIPHFLVDDDPRPAAVQFNERYAHGGGWMPMEGWRALPDGRVEYPGDPPLTPIAASMLRSETIRVYPYGLVMITQLDGSFEISRMD